MIVVSVVSPSTTSSSTPVTVTVWASSQVRSVNLSTTSSVGSVRTSPVSRDVTDTVASVWSSDSNVSTTSEMG